MKNETTTKLVTRLFGTALIGGAMLSGHAFASNPIDEARATVVKFGDLNLESPQGIASLYKRIHNASEQVCAMPSADRLFLAGATLEQKCVAATEARAIGDIHNVALEAYYATKTGRPTPVLASNQK